MVWLVASKCTGEGEERDLWPLIGVTVHRGKGNNQKFGGLLDTDCE